jgi:hypothetical protein
MRTPSFRIKHKVIKTDASELNCQCSYYMKLYYFSATTTAGLEVLSSIIELLLTSSSSSCDYVPNLLRKQTQEGTNLGFI